LSFAFIGLSDQSYVERRWRHSQAHCLATARMILIHRGVADRIWHSDSD
jgi:hypothetical protein